MSKDQYYTGTDEKKRGKMKAVLKKFFPKASYSEENAWSGYYFPWIVGRGEKRDEWTGIKAVVWSSQFFQV
ncbi:MAG: hypothetical protein AAB932_06405, partial [Patescibacteria group bacterium]